MQKELAVAKEQMKKIWQELKKVKGQKRKGDEDGGGESEKRARVEE